MYPIEAYLERPPHGVDPDHLMVLNIHEMRWHAAEHALCCALIAKNGAPQWHIAGRGHRRTA